MTIALLEGTVVEEAFDFDPITLQSGRVSELSSEFQPDVTRVTCKTFETLVRKVDDDGFADFLIELRQDQDRQAIMDQVRRSMYRALPAPEPTPTPASEDYLAPEWPFLSAPTIAHVGGGEYASEPYYPVDLGPIGESQAWEPLDEDVTAFTDAFPRVDATATDLPAIVFDEGVKDTGARYRKDFWGKAAGADFVKPQRESVRNKLRSAWRYLLRVRRSGQ
jgi:hypothetical protein